MFKRFMNRAISSHVRLLFIIACALDMLLIKATYLLTYLLLLLVFLNNLKQFYLSLHPSD